MRAIGKQISDYYRTETEEHALTVANQTQLTIILSIASIVAVCILISPIISRIEQRKYMGLKFFLNVEHNHLTILESQVREFLDLAFSDASVHTGATHQEGNAATTKGAHHTISHAHNMFVDNDRYNQDKDKIDGINQANAASESSSSHEGAGKDANKND